MRIILVEYQFMGAERGRCVELRQVSIFNNNNGSSQRRSNGTEQGQPVRQQERTSHSGDIWNVMGELPDCGSV